MRKFHTTELSDHTLAHLSNFQDDSLLYAGKASETTLTKEVYNEMLAMWRDT